TGTSMATPHVSGIAALIWSREPGLTPGEVKQRIRRTAQPIVALASRVASSGRANALAALNDTVPDPDLALASVETNKKFVTVNGLAFAKDSFVVEVNGIPLTGKVTFDNAFMLGNGTFSQARVKAGKAQVKNLFPVNTTVQVTVFDPTTGKRTIAVGYRKL
ncbi:MAG TPA: S8 family serine peptidase, partial [Blastocatellia bacterium]|nr:S8 family serine peptidase [Blastocatellia bacterium]